MAFYFLKPFSYDYLGRRKTSIVYTFDESFDTNGIRNIRIQSKVNFLLSCTVSQIQVKTKFRADCVLEDFVSPLHSK